MADASSHTNVRHVDQPSSQPITPSVEPTLPFPHQPQPPPPPPPPPPRPPSSLLSIIRHRSKSLRPNIAVITTEQQLLVPISKRQSSSPKGIGMSSASSEGTTSRTVTTVAGKHPKYRGIRSRSGKWVSEIREPRKTTRIWLGTYPTPEMAAAAYDAAALALKGEDVVLNFPDHFQSYPVPASQSPKDIRSAACTAAAMMKQGTIGGDETRLQPETDNASVECGDATSGNEIIDDQDLSDMPMPNLLLDMAGGMLMSPPRMNSPPSDKDTSDQENLWGYF